MTHSPLISSFGRRAGRSLTARQQMLVDELLPTLCIPDTADAGITPKPKAIHLEIGFGGGEHLAAQAAANHDILYLGCEPYMNGVAKLLSVIDEQKLTNIRLFTDDARLLIDRLPEASIATIYILFPDPWPKMRHHKRRIISQATFESLARIQPVGGRLLLATDHEDYSVWMFEQLRETPYYEWIAERESDWATPPADWVQTRYERKTTEQGRPPVFIECRRI